ncbi:response regulator [Phenylobacterium sp.]|uniref:sensor histidine kinase n=1 Tax=Phenylobacterium sp. TaxID=1871053 RepID=UPI001229F241|nr:response regulator [Phenylobacterium sp.]THD58607.1 MAG: response regulator [Phenylobacterium sp.]
MSGDQRRVLYVDDDEGLRSLVRRALERRGYAVTLAATGEEGLARLDAEAFDVVALDHYMPGQGGFETLKQIRERPDPPPIVYVTGSDESRVAVSALKAGASDYVVKTVGEEFFDLLESAMLQAFAQVELRRRHAKAEADLVTSNQRLEALLHEVNHRVANSLQLVSAFVQMQASAVEGVARSALKDTQRRIEAIIQVHRRLYSSEDVESVDMQDYLAALVRELQDTLSSAAAPRRLSLAADEVRLETDKAVSVGVIVNELVTNACKYAYRRGEAGEVRIRLARDGQDLLLTVEDDGAGMAEGGQVHGTGLGGRLIKAMASSLNSEVVYDPAHAGVRASLRLPAS